jgi:hypothetical protein
MIGFWVMSVCVFRFVQRRTSALFATLATLFLLATPGYGYAYEARPYGLVLGCCGLSLLGWQHATGNRKRKLGLAIVALVPGPCETARTAFFSL